ncbi:hypothetical protein EQG79_05895 [Spirosoma sordidisoli]|uniref:NUMOD4 domain-containing protein n=1 Tax=Spirosoma sordidisoli TaxID=2502893 RepID=A0A4Q2UYM8_9BACT|nr:hypothetical protein EQG79_05895 [Spirosoma sordidisoli]
MQLTKRYISLSVQRLWDIDGYHNYFFDQAGQLYRFTARGDVKTVRRTMKRYTQGYVLTSKFYSLTQLRPLLRRHVPTDYLMGS